MLGRNTKRDDVGQRIQLLAKIAGRIGHAGDAPVERVKRNREQDGERRIVEVPRLKPRPLQALRDGVVPGGDIARRKQRRQHEHTASPWPFTLNHRRVSITSFRSIGS